MRDSLEQCWLAEQQQAAMNAFQLQKRFFVLRKMTPATDCLVQALSLKHEGRFFFVRESF